LRRTGVPRFQIRSGATGKEHCFRLISTKTDGRMIRSSSAVTWKPHVVPSVTLHRTRTSVHRHWFPNINTSYKHYIHLYIVRFSTCIFNIIITIYKVLVSVSLCQKSFRSRVRSVNRQTDQYNAQDISAMRRYKNQNRSFFSLSHLQTLEFQEKQFGYEICFLTKKSLQFQVM